MYCVVVIETGGSKGEAGEKKGTQSWIWGVVVSGIVLCIVGLVILLLVFRRRRRRSSAITQYIYILCTYYDIYDTCCCI